MSIILLFSMGFMACKKESTTQVKTTQEKLLGKWNFVSTISNHFYSGFPHIVTTAGAAGDMQISEMTERFILTLLARMILQLTA